MDELKPTGPRTFLLAHKGGLSAYLGSNGWEHHPLPENCPGWFKEFHGVLSGGPKAYWWQPFPGILLQVLANGTPKTVWSPKELLTGEPFARDAKLLHFLGADASGQLWFDLSVPSESMAMPHSPATVKPPDQAVSDPPPGPTPQASIPWEDWQTYLDQGLGRIYCWDAQQEALRRFKWSQLLVPSGFQKPLNGVKFLPESGVLMLENDSSSWLLPISALPLGEASRTITPDQAK
jgi:hypothetical protein